MRDTNTNIIKVLKATYSKACLLFYGLCGMLFTTPIFAAAGDDFKIGQGSKPFYIDKDKTAVHGVGSYFKEGGRIVLLAASAGLFLWIAYMAVAKFRECQKGVADWSELIVLGAVAAAVLVFVTILLSSAGEPLKKG